MRRNLKFWTRYTWENAEILLAVTALLGVLMLLGRERPAWDVFAARVPYLLLMSGCFTLYIVNTSSHQLYIPLLIAMGETRRNILYGFLYYRLLAIAGTLAACGLIWGLIPGEISREGLRHLPILLVTMLLASALGSIAGTLTVRWKWVALVAIMIPSGIFGGLIGYMGVGGGTRLEKVLQVASRLLTGTVWPLVLATAVLLAVDGLLQYRVVMTREAKI